MSTESFKTAEAYESGVLSFLKSKIRAGAKLPDEVYENTPYRNYEAMVELTSGYNLRPRDILFKRFSADYSDQVVMTQGLDFVSLCTHHMLPFYGVAHIAYLPGTSRQVVGLSKLARLLYCRSRRLQMQEAMSWEIAMDINKYLEPSGVAVVVKAEHSCMKHRGIKSAGAMVTSVMLGEFRDNQTLREEFFSLVKA